MSIQRKVKAQNRPPQFLGNSGQTGLSTYHKEEKASDSQSILTEESPARQSARGAPAQDALQIAVRFFEKGPIKTSRSKNTIMEKHLRIVEDKAWRSGLVPETIDVLLNVALSGKFGSAVSTRILKCLIPASIISEDSVVKAVSWLCVGKCSRSAKVLFYRWLVAMFEFIDEKEQISLLYGFFFASLQDDAVCPYACHFLYLLTKKEHVKPFRVRKLLDLQAKMGAQPHLQALLSLYKFFVPSLISVTLPLRKKIYFKNPENLWNAAPLAVRLRNQGPFPHPLKPTFGPANIRSLKRRWTPNSLIPAQHSGSDIKESGRKAMRLSECLGCSPSLPSDELRSFSQLLQNLPCLELPSQMGSVLNSPLLLHYINCVRDESLLLRLYHWLSQALQEECIWYKVNNCEQGKEFTSFLDTVIGAQCFLQEGFYSCAVFLYKSLPLWDGLCCRSQFLQLVSWIPFSSFSEMKPLIFDYLTQLFFTSTIYFKCSVLQSLKELLQNWLLCLSLDVRTKPATSSPLETTLGGCMDSVRKLIRYVGWLGTAALRMESHRALLMHFVLDFYEKVCDIYTDHQLPLLMLCPPGIFYPALLSLDASVLNRLCYVMHRYRENLIAAKENALVQKAQSEFSFNSKTYQQFNQYLTTMVGCLWTSRPFEKGMHIDPRVFQRAGVAEYKSSLSLARHPSLLSYALSFLLQENPEERTMNMSSIWGKKWNCYLDYLFSEGLQGLKLFIRSNIRHSSAS